MRDVTADNLSTVFNSYMGPDINPRLREVMSSLVHHLHAFAKDVNLTHTEWEVKAPGYRNLVTEVFPEDDPYLDQDTVFGVREDLVMRYQEMPAASFPAGFELSGSVDQPYLQVDFDLTLVADE